MKTTKLLALAVVTLLTAYGCSASDEDDSAPSEAATEDQLQLFPGNVDNAAIVEATTMMLTSTLSAPPLDGNLDDYNQADPFKIGVGPYKAAFAKNLTKFDNEDGKTDWTAAQIATWTTRLGAGNYIVVDTSKPCVYDNPHTYLEIERAQLTGKTHTTCGGRMPNEDALDVTLNFLIRGPAASDQDPDAISDGVEHATKVATAGFPYLAEMNGF